MRAFDGASKVGAVTVPESLEKLQLLKLQLLQHRAHQHSVAVNSLYLDRAQAHAHASWAAAYSIPSSAPHSQLKKGSYRERNQYFLG